MLLSAPSCADIVQAVPSCFTQPFPSFSVWAVHGGAGTQRGWWKARRAPSTLLWITEPLCSGERGLTAAWGLEGCWYLLPPLCFLPQPFLAPLKAPHLPPTSLPLISLWVWTELLSCL